MQQSGGNVGGLTGGARDPQQAFAAALRQVILGQKQLGGARNDRQRCSKLVRYIGVERLVALDQFLESAGVVVKRCGQLPDLVIREVTRQIGVGRMLVHGRSEEHTSELQ